MWLNLGCLFWMNNLDPWIRRWPQSIQIIYGKIKYFFHRAAIQKVMSKEMDNDQLKIGFQNCEEKLQNKVFYICVNVKWYNSHIEKIQEVWVINIALLSPNS